MRANHTGDDVTWTAATRQTDGDMASNLTSDWIDCEGYSDLSATFHADSATHVGTMTVDLTDHPAGTHSNDEPITPVPTAASGSAFDHRISIALGGAKKARFKYAAGSGAGTLVGKYTLKN